MRPLIVFLCSIGVIPEGARAADIMFSCTDPSGHAYYSPGPLVPEDRSGWVDDQITGGIIQWTLDGDQSDILLKHAGGLSSARADGGQVIVLHAINDSATLLVNYAQGVSEIYTFDAKTQKVYWTQHKFGMAVDKVAAFVANCSLDN